MTYSDETMEPIRVLHYPVEDTWCSESPDIPRWMAVADTFDEARQLAEEGVRFALERDDVTIEHFWPVPPGASTSAPPAAAHAAAPGPPQH